MWCASRFHTWTTFILNDIGNASDCEILSFADDTTLILSDPDLRCLYEKSNVEINYTPGFVQINYS